MSLPQVRRRGTSVSQGAMLVTYSDCVIPVIQRTQSGQLILNDTFGQLAVTEIPFGGQGESGCQFRSLLVSAHVLMLRSLLQTDPTLENTHLTPSYTSGDPSMSLWTKGKCFSEYFRSWLTATRRTEGFMTGRYPPYSPPALEFFSQALKVKIPDA